MPGRTQSKRRGRRLRRDRDWGRAIARLLCLLFALVGAVPLMGGILLRSEPLTKWAAGETTRLLSQQLGIQATFAVELSLIPLRLAVTDLTVQATDSDQPAVVARSIAVSPRLFSLLAGRIDVGDISLDDTQVRLVVRDGKVENVAYRFPDSRGDSMLSRAPFRSLSVSNAELDLKVDDMHLLTGSIDLDAIVQDALSFDVALHAAPSTLLAKRSTQEGATYYDEDQLCELDLRMYLSREEILIRRLSLLGVLDDDPAVDTLPLCSEESPNQIALRLSQLKVVPQPQGAPHLRGHVLVRSPTLLLTRFFPRLHTTGWAAFAGEVSFDETTKLPELSGRLSGDDLSMAEFAIAQELSAEVMVSGDVVQIPRMSARWGNGEARLSGVVVSPFLPKMPLSIEHVSTDGIDMPGVMRDVGVTAHAWVDWNFAKTELKKIEGTLAPFFIDGAFDGPTENFVVWDRGFDHPGKQRMVAIARPHAQGRFRAHGDALEFYDANVDFGNSHLPVNLVSVGFRQKPLIVRLGPNGGALDLGDISPIAGLPFSGQTVLNVELAGPMAHPILTGTFSGRALQIAGYDAGDVEAADVRFEPLFVEFSNLRAQKGAMRYEVPQARLSFDGPAAVEFKGHVKSPGFVLAEFLSAFHLEEEPGMEDMRAEGEVSARVRYLLGGPEDTCGAGRLHVVGQAELDSVHALGEQFSAGSTSFSFEWFDIEAGLSGMRLAVPQLTLRKGNGTLFATVDVDPGGILSGDILGTRIPISRVNAFRRAFAQADGFLTGAAQLGGTLTDLAFSADLSLSELKAQNAHFKPSSFHVQLVPVHTAKPQTKTRTGCGRSVAVDDTASTATDPEEPEGTFIVNGHLFGNEVRLFDTKITRHRVPRISGRALLSELDVAATLALFGVEESARAFAGQISGDLNVTNFTTEDPFGASASLGITEASLTQNGLIVELADKRASLRIADRNLSSRHLVLRATARGGQSAMIDAQVALDDQYQLATQLALRPTDLGVLSTALPGVERAAGQLEGKVTISGPVRAPQVVGYLKVHDGSLKLSGFDSPVEKMQLEVALDGGGMRVGKGDAVWGGGELRLFGSAPLSAGQLGRINLGIVARSVALPLGKDLNTKFNADLNLSVPPLSEETDELPLLSGSVNLLYGSYEKPMSMTADIATLTSRGDKTEVEDYDESKDSLRIDVLLRSSEAIRVKNALVQTSLTIDPSGLRVSGTDQRFGAVGNLHVETGGRMVLRRNEFEIQTGLVRFNDPTALRPEVDVTAVTEYRRLTDQGSTQGSGTQSTSATSGAPLGGNWRILMHAYGPPDNLKVDLASDPPLAQDDIFLLLTVGLTRTELDQSNSSGVGGSVALEALGSLSGAESAVTNVVPVDEFRFGSTYSSRSGRTEPTVTIGKRLSDRIRASVTTSLSDTSEVRSNVEYRATESLSVEGSFDNASNVATAAGANLGGDVRWRLEFR